MSRLTLRINGREAVVDVEPDMPLLWVLRDVLGLTGTKYGCGIGLCGSCTVHVAGSARRACVTPVGTIGDAEITTIEGLGGADTRHPVQQAWIAEQVPQCGWCQPGQVMHAAAVLAQQPAPTAAAVDEAMDSVLCRCGTYPRIARALRRLQGG